MPQDSQPAPHRHRLAELAARHAIADEGGPDPPPPGRLSARERLRLLLDEDSFEEIGKLVTHHATEFDMAARRTPGDGVVTGHGRIYGRPVFVFAQDATVFGGSFSGANAGKIVRLIEMATRVRAPLLGLYDTIGLRVQEGVAALGGFGELCRHLLKARDTVPYLAAVFGPLPAGALLAPLLSDFMVTTDPATEAAHLLVDGEPACLHTLRTLLAFLHADPPGALQEDLQHIDPTLDSLLPADPRQSYDVMELLTCIVDAGSFFAVQSHRAQSLVTGIARINGRPVGILANQAAVLEGALDAHACVKAVHLVRLCDAFRLPLLSFIDVPGFVGDTAAQAAELLAAMAHSLVPKIAVITRRAYGEAYAVMGSADCTFAWPSAEILAHSPEESVDLLHRSEFERLLYRAQAIMPQGVSLSEGQKQEILDETRQGWLEAFRERWANPYAAAEAGAVNAVIRPAETRRRILSALDLFAQPSS